MKTMNAVIYGFGVMGSSIAESIWTRKSINLTGALDTDQSLVGCDIGERFHNRIKTGIFVTDNSKELFSKSDIDAAVIATTSHLESIHTQIRECLDAGINVVSTCEELSYPWDKYEILAGKIDTHAKKYGVTVVGTGINPGYLMDTLPLLLTAPCLRVDSLRVVRMMNSARRRIPFMKKVGTGLTEKEFQRNIESRVITGHVGLLESIALISEGLGLALDKKEELPPEPVLAETDMEMPLGTLQKGRVAGLISRAFGVKNGERIIDLEFVAHAGVVEEYDEVLIDGEPAIHQRILGGVHGDSGTVGVTINTIPRVILAEPGLKLMKDLPLVSCVP
jgi:4-hydroxy-tetrahydrodipicolinate reductase